jgi:4a-hydroxytetrahydrobiopterin dehydratase
MTTTPTTAAQLRASKSRPGAGPVHSQRAGELLKELPGWGLSGDHLEKTYTFKDFYRTMAFVNAVAWVANQEDHHPDLEVGYSRCVVKFSTHDVGGLSENDFICAAKVDALTTP